jgi:hypothetical protein
MCDYFAKIKQEKRVIFIFDRDVPEVFRELSKRGNIDAYQIQSFPK